MKTDSPFFLIAGPCAIEDESTAFAIAEHTKSKVCEKTIDLIFKGSYRKANRSKLSSFTGIGDEKALKILAKIGADFELETITDVHESHEPEMVANFVSHLQIPAFLCRQTDLLLSAGKTGCTINLKRGNSFLPNPFLLDWKKSGLPETITSGCVKGEQHSVIQILLSMRLQLFV